MFFSNIIWNERQQHAHYFYAQSVEKEGHTHIIDGFTFSVNGRNDDDHFHYYSGVSSEFNKHKHRFYGKTGPAKPLKNGGHYHEISGRVYFNYTEPIKNDTGGVVYSQNLAQDVHDHTFKGTTSRGIGYFPKGW
ncbi:YmaF family protein [Bacillus timonensis]|nr:YmaF family protein [Bacillus timonensis]